MVLSIKHPIPWHAAGNRELGDSAGNVVQYTQETLGVICLAVNAHDKMRDALSAIDSLLHGDGSADEQIRTIVREALGKIGFATLSAILEAAQAPSADLDRAIATELQRPQMAFTGSMDAAMTLIPPGWKASWSTATTMSGPNDPQPAPSFIAELTSQDGLKVVKITSNSIALAVCAASLMAMEA